MFVIMSVLMSLLPIASFLSSVAHFRYENAIQECFTGAPRRPPPAHVVSTFAGALKWSDLRGLERRLAQRSDNGDVRRAPLRKRRRRTKKKAKKSASVQTPLLSIDSDSEQVKGAPTTFRKC